MSDTDVLVLGGGVNGLVAAGLVAAAGARVVLVEAGPGLGGMAGIVDVDGARRPVAATDLGLFRTDVAERLELAAHGWSAQEAPRRSSLVGWRSGPASDEGLTLFEEVDRAADSIGRVSRRDARAWGRFLEAVAGVLPAFEAVLRSSPGHGAAASIARYPDLMRFATASLDDLLRWWFESEGMRVALAGLALRHSGLGPRSEGTGWLLLHQLAGSTAERLRPHLRQATETGSGLVPALASSARERGVVIHHRMACTDLEVRDGRVRSARLGDGSTLEPRVVISTLGAGATLLGLAGAASLPVRAVRALRRLRTEGSTVRWIAPEGVLPADGRLVIAERLDDLQRAHDAMRRGEASPRPWQVMDVDAVEAHHLPHRCCRDPEQVSRFRRSVLEGLGLRTSDAEGVGGLWLDAAGLEERFGADRGCETGSVMSLDQSLVLRPLAGWCGVSTPVAGLLLGGAAAHPGGGVTGLPGLAAADAALRLLG